MTLKKRYAPWNDGKSGCKVELCSEGCKQKISDVNRGKNNRVGYKHSKETKRKISEANMGKPAPNKGIPHTEETKNKIGLSNSIALTGKIQSEETIKKRSIAMKGKNTYKRSDETKNKMSTAHKNMKLSETHKTNIRNSLKGHIVSEISKKKISIANMGVNNGMYGINGTKHHNWKGGISFEPYCEKFNNRFKESIRIQFNRTCFLCNKTEPKLAEEQKIKGKRPSKLSIHHVSYEKSCLCDDNKCEFVPLCRSCHSKTNHNRDDWNRLIIDKLKHEHFI